jgi:hypothetical protein
MKSDLNFKPYWKNCDYILNFLREKAQQKKKTAQIERIERGNEAELMKRNEFLTVSFDSN